ncbi:MAG: FAD:protein FMN transferase [Luteolibacter sp.]
MPDHDAAMTWVDPIRDALFFRHEAMNTEFAFRFVGVAERNAAGIARLCGEMLDTLEAQLSRYLPDSEVSRINQLQAGETLYLSQTTYACLRLALEASEHTGGLFDITQGARIGHRKSGSSDCAPQPTGSLILHPDAPAVTCTQPGLILDLGGIGKGFALDQLAELLADWGVQDALLTAGSSSMLAIGSSQWPIELTGSSDRETIRLCNQALSASGSGIQGAHIIHPAGDDAMPASPASRVWVVAKHAAYAEIWSTALMLVAPDDVCPIVAGDPDLTSIHIEHLGTIRQLK